MNEENFLYAHQGVVAEVISKKAFKAVVGFFKLSSFARKTVRPIVQDDPEPPPEPQPGTSDDTPSNLPSQKGRGKGRGKGNPRGKKYQKTEHVVQPVQQLVKCKMATQTDSDFESYLKLPEDQFADYQRYKEEQLMQKYLVTTILQEDFEDYEAAEVGYEH